MSAFTPEGFPISPTDFAVPPLVIDEDFRRRLFERMFQEVDVNPGLCQDAASWLLKDALSSPDLAANLMYRLTRPSGFNGVNTW